MSKFRKWHLREPKFAKFPGGHATGPPYKLAPSALIIIPYFPSHGVGISASSWLVIKKPFKVKKKCQAWNSNIKRSPVKRASKRSPVKRALKGAPVKGALKGVP